MRGDGECDPLMHTSVCVESARCAGIVDVTDVCVGVSGVTTP